MINTKINITDDINNLIDKILTDEIGAEFDRHIVELQAKKCEIISGILLNIKKTIDIQTIGENTIFTIREITK